MCPWGKNRCVCKNLTQVHTVWEKKNSNHTIFKQIKILWQILDFGWLNMSELKYIQEISHL